MITEKDPDGMRHVIQGLKLRRGHAVSRICRGYAKGNRQGSYLMSYVIAYTKAIKILEDAARKEKLLTEDKP